jgi:hypothetical protein
MSPKIHTFTKHDHAGEQLNRVDSQQSTESVIRLATSADRQRMRNELLRLIITSESRRKAAQQVAEREEGITTDGSANSQIEAPDA